MKRISLVINFLVCLLLLNTAAMAYQTNDINMYPTAKEGYEQKIIQLDTLTNEDQYMVELFVGKKTMVDACNRFGLMGEWQQQDVQGWGYHYYEFNSDSEIISTLIGCLDSTMQEKLVIGKGNLIRYNSQLPIVVYVPKGTELQYKIWSTNNELKQS
jgi:ecotin